jgi:protein ImuB
MPFACIFVPNFSVEALLRAEPELRLQAMAVLEGKAPLQKVLAVNEKAHQAGIEPGMAKLQVEACPETALRARSLLQESAAHAALLDCAQSFSPRVEDAASDTLLLDLAGLETMLGSLPQIARKIARRASNLGLESNVAVASNFDTALLAARGFSGVTVIAEGKEAEQLGSLPVEVMLGNVAAGEDEQNAGQILETLQRWGVRNLRALAALPEIALSERLGQAGVRLQKLARGAISRTLIPVEPPLIFEEAIELEYPLVLLEPLAFLLGRLLEQLCDRLAARALATQELRLKLELDNRFRGDDDDLPLQLRSEQAHEDARPHTTSFQRTLRLPVPLLDARTFLKLLQLDLKTHPPGAPIIKIHLAAEPVRPRAAQNGLFLPPSPQPEKLELTLAKITGIVGEDKVGSLQLLDTEGYCMRRFAPDKGPGLKAKAAKRSMLRPGAVPDGTRDSSTSAFPALPCRAFTFRRFAAGAQVAPPDSSLLALHEDNAVTALRIFRPPRRASVTLRNGTPSFIDCAKRPAARGDVLWAAGPWRSSGDWWEQEGWARDEWDIAVQQNAAIAFYRLVRDLLSGRWFLEGEYD